MAHHPPDPPRDAPSLRTELLFNLAFLAAGALLLAVVTALVAPVFWQSDLGIALLLLLIAADVGVARLVTTPMDRLVEATRAVADGELERRAPPAGTREFDRLAESVNRMTERLLDAQGLLVQAEKLASVGRLAAGVAHEVGNPLSAIGNYVEVLRRRGADAGATEAIAREAGRIDVIVRSLLDYARPRTARREPLDVGAAVDGAIALLEAQGVLRGVVLDRAGEPALPAVRGDRAALEQVFVNLLLNAVDAAGRGGRIAVRTTSLQAAGAPLAAAEMPGAGMRRADGGGGVVVAIADSGPGVAEALRERVFDPFYTTKDPGRGTGLGLAIVQRVVHDHGGRVAVGAGELGGALFTVTLPAAP
jgi:two-component system NtrC family sensor kinase